VRQLWSTDLSAPPLGLSLAREPGTFLLWDGEKMLARAGRQGRQELRRAAPGSVVAAALSDDGRHAAAVGRRGQVWLFTGELDLLWERTLPHRPVAVALDHLGKGLAVADEAGVHVFDATGRELWRASTPRPLVYLAFVPEAPALVGCAEFGLVCAFDHEGHCLWREGLVVHVGSLAVSGDGEQIVLACFTEGLCVYSLSRARQQRFPQAAPCRLAAVGYLGEPILTAGLENRLALHDAQGELRDELSLPAPPLALALSALGERAIVALSGGKVVGVEVATERPPEG
jgi:hypothetical protein